MLFGRTNKTAPQDADSANARLLVQAGYVDQLMAGVYSYLPLGLRVLEKINRIIREEMNALGAQELLMPALHPKETWDATGRWSDPGPEVMFQFKGRSGKEMGLGWTHEEIVTPLAKRFIRSYRDLPFAVYQIQDKFRNEPRAKSGLLRGREFWMKDMYSFHEDEADLQAFYDKAAAAYTRVFSRCGLDALIVEASGGAFSKYSHEFQVLTDAGEDTVFYCTACRYAQNKEIAEMKTGDACPTCGGTVAEGKAIEVGNIFQLKTRFTEPFDVRFTDAEGKEHPVVMGCYGIGPSRVMGTIAEVHQDERGLCWPAAIAPFSVHLISLIGKDADAAAKVRDQAQALYEQCTADKIEVLWDEREGVSAGEKFADADLIGIPVRLVVSEKTLRESSVEYKERASSDARLVPIENLAESLSA